MGLKFDLVYKESYQKFFNEEAPLPSELQNASPEDTATPKNIPNQNENPENTDQESNLPDPKDVIGVKTEILSLFKDFFNADPERQDDFKRYLAGRAVDVNNAEAIISKMKEFISVGKKPKENLI
jgi:hypothetical protein